MVTVLQEQLRLSSPQQLLNSYFEILLNVAERAVDREVAGPLKCPAATAHQVSGTFSPHPLGGARARQTAAWALTFPTPTWRQQPSLC